MKTADVVVIGGGVNGLNAAFNLAKLGAGKIVLVERGALTSGATGKSGAIVRTHYTNPFESSLAFESLKIFQTWADEVGGDCGWHPTGFVEIVPRGFEEELAANVRAQQEIGIRTRVVTQADLAAMFPEMFVDDIGAAAYEPDSGWADPNATAQAFAEAALNLGVELSTGCEATSVGGLYLMVGDSGSSFKTAPAIGRCLAEWIVEGAPRTADLSPFGLRRFEGENPWESASDSGLRGRTISR